MVIVFCDDPLKPRKVDEAYQREAEAAVGQGLQYTLASYEALVNSNDPVRAVQRVPAQAQPTLGVYRGWMLRPEHYAALYAALHEKGIQLINGPEAYRH